jgi:hypothetical protein
MSSRASESKVGRANGWRVEQVPLTVDEVGAAATIEPSGRTPTLHGLGPGPRMTSGRLRLVQGGEPSEITGLRIDESLEESSFFERGEEGDALAPTTSDREVDPPWSPSPKESAHRRARLRRVVAGVVGVASILAALAAGKAMVSPPRGSLDPTPEPTEPIVVAMGALDSVPVSVPTIGTELRVPSQREHRRPLRSEGSRHRARGSPCRDSLGRSTCGHASRAPVAGKDDAERAPSSARAESAGPRSLRR